MCSCGIVRRNSTIRVSVASDGIQGNFGFASSGRGTERRQVDFFAFIPPVPSIFAVPGDTNGVSDVFLHDDMITGATTRVSVDSDGAQANDMHPGRPAIERGWPLCGVHLARRPISSPAIPTAYRTSSCAT